jgi:hypothetical protein
MSHTATPRNLTTKLPLVLVTCAALTLGACGETRGERLVTGAALGAGAGVGVAAILGGQALTGAIIGGSVGGATGLVSNHSWFGHATWNPTTWY